jgi:hypothetical protein
MLGLCLWKNLGKKAGGGGPEKGGEGVRVSTQLTLCSNRADPTARYSHAYFTNTFPPNICAGGLRFLSNFRKFHMVSHECIPV